MIIEVDFPRNKEDSTLTFDMSLVYIYFFIISFIFWPYIEFGLFAFLDP